ncbi:UDP-N-acetylmuramoyl-tripeptide--D-alanyl-D-alanine ligase [Micromonospora sp. NBC_01796]|uniref:UDP-N-acetylmuramoyl-tripeptide--D-alanyl-D- alanine ligase n=1 Tax=Micromonospora sp. NBC_01796 TaxID=2975987 RepID=UPI002DD955D5|nr:UDP-N-acetylmuramoyl-tripeptide--D-alanyl-D-alanine ligase [Micromonospora sp. NBC_01796]WSA83439.1 UDP-N-acetylmuramoyl-tripeptide--D-alanyl-D-alanine ligase [Micromonospora sp. NBC_01796]
MIALTLAEVAAAVDGRLVGADPTARVTGPVEFDSRKVRPGSLFVAFPGEHVDGHDYAAAAVQAGAVAVLGTREVDGVPMVLVADALTAMGPLARAVVDRLPELTVIGLTGSSGKTSTKDLVAQLVSRLGPTVAPPGSFNNELGHPYTALQADEQTRFLVLEKGARGPGHVRYLTRVVPPRIAVVLNVGVAHVGEFGSVEAIAQAKGELVEALPAAADGGVAVLNADDPRVRAMASRTTARVVLVGEAADAEVRATGVTLDDRGRASFLLVTPDGSVPVRLGLSGRHQVGNALAAAAVALEVGLPLADLATALGELRLVSTRRMDVFDRPDGVTVIDDSYNANPASMSAALRALAEFGRDRRTVAVLGYMAELGEFEQQGHDEVGRLAADLGVDRLFVVGDSAAPIHHGASAVGTWGGVSVLVTDQAEAVAAVRAQLRPGDVVLVKGSRYRTWEVVDALRADATTGTGNGTEGVDA